MKILHKINNWNPPGYVILGFILFGIAIPPPEYTKPEIANTIWYSLLYYPSDIIGMIGFMLFVRKILRRMFR